MAERSGIAAQLGIATEEEYGVYEAPATFLPFTSESLALTKEYIRSQGLRAGRLVQAKTLHLDTTRTVGGDVSLEFFNQGMGKLLNLLHGEEVAPAEIEGTSPKAYKQVHKVGLVSPFDKSLTLQVGRPDTGGTVRAFSYLGCKLVTASLAVESGGVTSLNLTFDGQDEDTGEALGEATYDTDAVPFTFQQVVAKVGGSEVANVRSITFNIEIPQSTDRYHLGNEGLKDQPIANELIAVTADATLEFSSLSDHERFTGASTAKLETIATGASIDSEPATNFKATLTAPAAKQVSSSPTVQGPDIITQDVSFECLDNGTEAPLTIETVSTDSAL